MNKLIESAHIFSDWGLSVIPTKEDKSPAISWAPYQKRRMITKELETNFSNRKACGVGIICGKISGNLEVIDIDCKYDTSGTLKEDFFDFIKVSLPDLLDRFVITSTKNKGWHLYYRCHAVDGNKKLAVNKQGQVLIETRGQGGYVIAPPSDGYALISGDFDSIPEISIDQRKTLLDIATTFDESQTESTQSNFENYNAGFSPFDAYNNRADVVELLEKHDWVTVRQSGDNIQLRRPGKDEGISANWHKSKRTFLVFSTSTKFVPMKGYNAVGVYCILECNNDFSEASKKLYDEGYGERRETQNNSETNEDGQGHEFDGKKLAKFPESVYNDLPPFLKHCIEPLKDDPARDILLLGLIAIISGMLPNYYSHYSKGEYIESNLKAFIIAIAGEGKGILKWCRVLAQEINNYLREKQKQADLKYHEEKADFDQLKKADRVFATEPVPPKNTMLFIPINNSMAGVYELLNENNERGILFSSEADTMTNIYASDFGDYSTLERQSFHHEPAEYYRKTDKQYICLEKPKITTLLSGTMSQAHLLMKSTENGLFSRYMYYYYDCDSDFELDFRFQDNSLEDHFVRQGNVLLGKFKLLEDKVLEFRLTKEQQSLLNEHFKPIEQKFKKVFGREVKATIRRLCLQTYRIAMILTFLRNIDKLDNYECSDIDFFNSIEISKVLLEHALRLFNALPKSDGKAGQTVGAAIVSKDVAIYLRKNTEMTYTEINKILKLNYSRQWYSKMKNK